MTRPACISLETLRTLGIEKRTELFAALAVEAKAQEALASANARVEQLFSEIALSGMAPVEVAPLAIDPEPIVLKPRPQDKSQEAVMPLAQPFDVAFKVPSVPAPAEAEAMAEGVTPCPSVVVEPAPVVEIPLPATGAKEEVWLPIREISARLGILGNRFARASRDWESRTEGGSFIYRLSDATEYARTKGWLDDVSTEKKPAYQPLDKPYFERLGIDHVNAMEEGKREAEKAERSVFYIIFNEQTGEVSHAARKGVVDETPGLVAIERWEKSRGGIWDSQPIGKGLDGAMGAHMHTRAIGARVLA